MSNQRSTEQNFSEAFIRGEELGKDYHIYQPDGVADVEGLVGKLGGEILRLDSAVINTKMNNEFVTVFDEGDFRINIAQNTVSNFDRVQIAEGIGHYILHFIRPRALSNDGSTPRQAIFRSNSYVGITGQAKYTTMSKEIQYFAEGLLLPDDVTKVHFTGSSEQIGRALKLPKWIIDDRKYDLQSENR